jgi:hypothetical protein
MLRKDPFIGLARTVLAKVKYLSDKWCREIKENPCYNENNIKASP